MAFSIRAAFIGKPLPDGGTMYTSRLTGHSYIVKPDGGGFVVSSDYYPTVAVATRYGAMKIIEQDDIL